MKHLLNPFQKMAGWQALIFGLTAIAITSILAAVFDVHLDGILEMHLNGEVGMALAIQENLINWLTLVVVFGVAAWLFNRGGFRILDLLGIMAFARVPFIPLPPLNEIFKARMIGKKIEQNLLEDSGAFMLSNSETVLFTAYLIISLLFIILSVTWMYNGFRILSNARGIKTNAAFIVAILAGSVLSKVLINWLQ